MDVNQMTVFTFTTTAEGQGFNFSIPGATRAEAAANLLRKLQIVTKELEGMVNTAKSTAAN